jgi:SAM-dependent methyltransferase
MSGYDRVVQPAAGDEALENHLGGDEARNYRRYEFDMVAPHVGRSMLEIGSGLGHFAEQFLPRLDRLVVSDFDPYCVGQLGKRFEGRDEIEVLQFGLPTEIPLAKPVDTVVMMNVLEHIEEDAEALRSLAKVTEPGGRIIIWVPGYMQLYGDFDRKVGHVTRYTPSTLGRTVARAGLRAEVLKPINFLGGIAWWAASSARRSARRSSAWPASRTDPREAPGPLNGSPAAGDRPDEKADGVRSVRG